jgi:ankyrin repeat protein
MIHFTRRSPIVHQISGFFVCVLMAVAGVASAGDVDALYKAAGDGNAAQVSGLLDSGVNVNGRTSDGSYALNRAAVENHVDVARLLLDRGADPNVQNSQGDTPLICAVKYAGGKAATVKLLVEAGTDLSIKDDKGKTALDYAKSEGQQEASALLEGSDSKGAGGGAKTTVR